jgi:DNA-binding MarR family transcriptional regulator
VKVKDPLSLLPGYALRRASSAMQHDLGLRLSSLGLTATEASILILVDANAQATQSDVGRTLGIKRANMTPLTARLVDRALMERQRFDGRSQILRLTSIGDAILKDVWRAVEAHEAHLISHIPIADRPGFAAALKALYEKL